VPSRVNYVVVSQEFCAVRGWTASESHQEYQMDRVFVNCLMVVKRQSGDIMIFVDYGGRRVRRALWNFRNNFAWCQRFQCMPVLETCNELSRRVRHIFN